jgi:hypothetical protein
MLGDVGGHEEACKDTKKHARVPKKMTFFLVSKDDGSTKKNTNK